MSPSYPYHIIDVNISHQPATTRVSGRANAVLLSYIRVASVVLVVIGLTVVVMLLATLFSRTSSNHAQIMQELSYRRFVPTLSISHLTEPPSPAVVPSAVHSPSPVSTRPIEIPLHSELDFTLSDDGSASQPLPPPPRVVSGQDADGTHHTRFTNVCMNIGKDDKKTLQFFHVDPETREAFDREYWSQNSPQWQLFHTYLDDTQSRQFPLPGSLMLPGRTFALLLAVDNIAQYYQEVVCHMPALIDPVYQHNHSLSGYDHLFTLHLNVNDADGTIKRDWCESQTHLIADTMQALQSDRVIHVLDSLAWNQYSRPQSICFDELIIYNPNHCQWNAETSPYPVSLKAAHESHLNRAFDSLHLRKEVPCVQNITIYTRMDASRRKLLNGDELRDYLVQQGQEHGLDIRVSVLDRITGDLYAQAAMYNAHEMHIAPHSGSAYNAMWLPLHGGVYVEVGQHGTWYGRGTGPLSPQFFRAINTGYITPPFNSSLDNHDHIGERSFEASPELMKAIFDTTMFDAPVSFCRRI